MVEVAEQQEREAMAGRLLGVVPRSDFINRSIHYLHLSSTVAGRVQGDHVLLSPKPLYLDHSSQPAIQGVLGESLSGSFPSSRAQRI